MGTRPFPLQAAAAAAGGHRAREARTGPRPTLVILGVAANAHDVAGDTGERELQGWPREVDDDG